MRANVVGALFRGLKVFGSSVVLAALVAAPASAGVGGAAGPTWPAVLAIGNPVSAYIDIVNASDGVNAVENVNAPKLFVRFSARRKASEGVCARVPAMSSASACSLTMVSSSQSRKHWCS